ncbi:MAG: hypothetical protein JO322_08205 [Candidatus Eremiobacteraeota bacterium]|nr:hypothetical protein [Candidatus Eremiobacteraeota bacterium]
MKVRSEIKILTYSALAACVMTTVLVFPRPVRSMPNFAQAYGIKCSYCHIQIPALNAYGRYVQRTGYAGLNPHVLERESPIWVDYPVGYSQQAPNAGSWDIGSLGLHADGAFGTEKSEWTYHVQQWLWQGSEPGGLDTAWVAYNNFFNGAGHIFAGKLEVPAPSEFSQWFDVSGLTVNSAAEMTVGEHVYELDTNRWGYKFAYIRGSLDAEVSYGTSTADINGFNAYDWMQDKTLQYKLAFANRSNPLEIGYFGARGSWPLSEGGFDQYYTNGFYAQRDPIKAVPGFLATYQMNYDGNPGMGATPAGSNGFSYELFENIGQRGLVSAGEQFTNDGMGNHTQIGNIDLSYHVTRFIMVYAEEALSVGQKPTWNGLVWFALPTGPLWPPNLAPQ